ncbi:glycosyltransferase family 2 protein [Brachybacterium sp. UMB0905]|uniref:glycosyltransferase family 2 protein n=1 Tax=Brachybacterium sp. UMB0905 TaxID=2069310 RepID=UPI000C801EF8|nr:glycosyltransferase family 2 protein [Brachybacterium sp. UMB0905]PMC74782.1 glycosyltransferase family 2 protein [Brachybacterium sp. UMB0905]
MSIAHLGVVIPVHGPLDEAVQGLLTALIGPDVPAAERPGAVVVVDDASPEPLDPAALPAGAELVRRPRNGGFGAAVNTGLTHLADHGAADGGGIDLALVLNSDLEIPPGFAANLVVHAAPWQPAVVGCRIIGPDGMSGHAARFFPTTSQQVIEWLVPLASQRHRDVLHRAVGHDLSADRGHGMIPVDWVSGAVLLLPLAQVREAGGFDEGYFMYCEEVDLQLRLRARGIPALLDADLTAIHAGGGSAGNEARRRRWLLGARLRYARKHGSIHALRAGLTAASCANLLWNTGRRAAGRDVNPLAVAREELTLIHRAGRELPR